MWQKLKHFFIPCEENTYRPHFLERFSMGVMLFMVLLTFAMANIQALLWMSSEWMTSAILPAVIVERTNVERGTETLQALSRNTLLDQAATLKAQDMAEKGYFAHYSPEGVSPWFWFEQAGYNYLHAGENLAVRFTDSREVVDAWMNSPTHRANIMNGSYTEIGIGTARGEYKGSPTVFVVQLFGTPRAMSVQQVAVIQETTVSEVLDTAPIALGSNEEPTVLAEEITAPSTAVNPNTSLSSDTPVNDIEEEVSTIDTILIEDVFEDDVVVYSGTASTSREGIPAGIDPMLSSGGPDISVFERSAVQPSMWLQFVYAVLGVMVSTALIVSLIVEWRRNNPVQIAYTGGLLTTMALLFYVHTMLTSGIIIA